MNYAQQARRVEANALPAVRLELFFCSGQVREIAPERNEKERECDFIFLLSDCISIIYTKFENTYKAIIDPETWKIVQKAREQRRRPTKMWEMGMFSGLAYCADCGAKLYHAGQLHGHMNRSAIPALTTIPGSNAPLITSGLWSWSGWCFKTCKG